MQTRLKRGIFFSSLGEKFKAICLLSLVRKLVRIPLPLFWLGPAPQIFTKLLKVPITILDRIIIKIIIYLDDMLLIGHSLEEIIMSRDIVIFLLQHLGFVISWKKPVLTPVQEIEFLGPTVNSVTLEFL